MSPDSANKFIYIKVLIRYNPYILQSFQIFIQRISIPDLYDLNLVYRCWISIDFFNTMHPCMIWNKLLYYIFSYKNNRHAFQMIPLITIFGGGQWNFNSAGFFWLIVMNICYADLIRTTNYSVSPVPVLSQGVYGLLG